MAMQKNDDVTLDHVHEIVEQEHDCNLENLDKIDNEEICEKFTRRFANVNVSLQEIDNLKKMNGCLCAKLNTSLQEIDNLKRSNLRLFDKVNTSSQEIDNLKKSHVEFANVINPLVQKQQHLQLVHATLAKNINQLENEYVRKHELLMDKLEFLNHM